MKLANCAKVLFISVLAMLMVACGAGASGDVSHYRPREEKTLVGNKVARAYGMPKDYRYQQVPVASTNARRHVNALRAPANQVYYFAFDQSGVDRTDLRAMQIQARYLATHPSARIRLEGSTDNRGSREYNIGLGWRRDQSVEGILMQYGVSPKQIELVSYGKERPAVLGNSERAWSLNRRVNLIYKAY